jgi:hypothetical protein
LKPEKKNEAKNETEIEKVDPGVAIFTSTFFMHVIFHYAGGLVYRPLPYYLFGVPTQKGL